MRRKNAFETLKSFVRMHHINNTGYYILNYNLVIFKHKINHILSLVSQAHRLGLLPDTRVLGHIRVCPTVCKGIISNRRKR